MTGGKTGPPTQLQAGNDSWLRLNCACRLGVPHCDLNLFVTGRWDSHRVLGSDSWMLWYDIRLRFLGRDGFHVSQEAS